MRNERQEGMFPAKTLQDITAAVVGVGAIGRQVALQLASVGIPRLILIDPDVVEEVNLGPQGWNESDLGDNKVYGAAVSCVALSSGTEVIAVPEKFKKSKGRNLEVIFCCVDKMAARELIFSLARTTCRFFADGRMSSQVCRILTATDPESREHYRTTLFPDSEAQGTSCTTRSTIYCANIAAGFMLSQFSVWLRGGTPYNDRIVNIDSMSMYQG